MLFAEFFISRYYFFFAKYRIFFEFFRLIHFRSSLKIGFRIAISLRTITLNSAQLFSNSAQLRNCAQLGAIARNYVQLRAIVRSLQGSQMRVSKIHLRWKPYLKIISYLKTWKSLLKCLLDA